MTNLFIVFRWKFAFISVPKSLRDRTPECDRLRSNSLALLILATRFYSVVGLGPAIVDTLFAVLLFFFYVLCSTSRFCVSLVASTFSCALQHPQA